MYHSATGIFFAIFISFVFLQISQCADENLHQLEESLVSAPILPSFTSKLLPIQRGFNSLEKTTSLGTPFVFNGPKPPSKEFLRKHKKYHPKTDQLSYFGFPIINNQTKTAHERMINPTRTAVALEQILFRQKRCFTCALTDGSNGQMMSGSGSGNRMVDLQMAGQNQNFNRVLIQPVGVQQVQPQSRLVMQGADGQLTTLGAGTYTFAGGVQTTLIDGYAYTLSSYTRIINGIPTIGVVTLVPMQTFYNNRLLQPGENAFGVPNVGVYTLPGPVSVFQSQGYPYTISTFTKIVDGAATYGAVTLAGVQTYFNNRLLRPDENPYGVPNVGTYTLPGNMQTIYLSGYPMTVSSYTKIVDGVATFGTATLGGMQTYFAGKLLAPGENPYGVPNVGTYTLPGPMSQFNDENGYPLTVSSYTKIVNGLATFGSVTQGMKATYYNGKILRYGENPYGVPNEGIYTLPGSINRILVNGQEQTLSTYTRIVDGAATYGTVTQMQMQTIFVPAGQQYVGDKVLVPVDVNNGNMGMGDWNSGQQVIRQVIPVVAVQNNGMGGNLGSGSCDVCGK